MEISVMFRNISINSKCFFNAWYPETCHRTVHVSGFYAYFMTYTTLFWRKPKRAKNKKMADCTTNGDHVPNSDSKTNQHDEELYLEAVQRVIDHGRRKSNRTGIDTLSTFGMQMRSVLFLFIYCSMLWLCFNMYSNWFENASGIRPRNSYFRNENVIWDYCCICITKHQKKKRAFVISNSRG